MQFVSIFPHGIPEHRFIVTYYAAEKFFHITIFFIHCSCIIL